MFSVQILTRHLSRNLKRFSGSSAALNQIPEPAPQAKLKSENLRKSVVQLRHVYPEFLPDPKIEYRNSVREKLERKDMIARRTRVDIPEFYVGSILAVTSSDQHAATKIKDKASTKSKDDAETESKENSAPIEPHKFVGICIKREGCGLRANFILRNVIDHQGVEILYELYDPTIISIEVLKLEKRLDNELLYLRDALPEYSMVDPNMEVVIQPLGSEVPINDIKVKLKPRPWLERWERKNLKGVQDLGLPNFFYERAKKHEKPWEKYDLMKEYMRTIPEDEQTEIFSEIKAQLHKVGVVTQKVKRKRTFVKPVKLA